MSSSVAVSIIRQTYQYDLVPKHLDYTERYGGSVGKLQRDVETRTIAIPASGIYIRSERLSNNEGQDVFFHISAQGAVASTEAGHKNANSDNSSLDSEVPIWQHKGEGEHSWSFYSSHHAQQLSQALTRGTDTVLLEAGTQRWIVDLIGMEQRLMGQTSRRHVRCLNGVTRPPTAPEAGVTSMSLPGEDMARDTIQRVLHKKLRIGQIKRSEYNIIRRLSVQNSQPDEVFFCGYTYVRAYMSLTSRSHALMRRGKCGNRRWSSIRREDTAGDSSGYILEQHASYEAFVLASDSGGAVSRKNSKNKAKVSMALRDCKLNFSGDKMQIEVQTTKGKKETFYIGNKVEFVAWKALLRLIVEGVSDKPCVFGVELSAKHLPKHIINGSIKVPTIVAQCCGLLVRHGLQTPSLFRIPGDEERCQKLAQQYEESDNIDLHKEFNVDNIAADPGAPVPILTSRDAHDVASLLKMYLMKLPSPLVPTGQYHSFLQFGKIIQMKRKTMQTTDDPRVAAMQNPAVILRPAITALPTPNRDCLRFLVGFLVKLSSHSKVNKMTATAIGVCFAPTFLQPPKEDTAHMEANPQMALTDATVCSKVIAEMITNADLIFTNDVTRPAALAVAPPLPRPAVKLPCRVAPGDMHGGAVNGSIFDNDTEGMDTATAVVEAVTAEVVHTDRSAAQYAVEHGAQSIKQWCGGAKGKAPPLPTFPIMQYQTPSSGARADTQPRVLEYSSREVSGPEPRFVESDGKIILMQIHRPQPTTTAVAARTAQPDDIFLI